MWVNTYVNSAAQIDECAASAHVQEVLLEAEALCRNGSLSMTQTLALAIYARGKGLQTVLVWDILMNEALMRDSLELVKALDLGLFDAVRVTDPGALKWLLESRQKVQIHVNLEKVNNNLQALQSWCEYVKTVRGSRPERILLSLELPEGKLCQYCRTLAVPCEYLGAGRIEIFQSARHLLGERLLPQEGTACIETVVSSADMQDRPLLCVETAHGTMLYFDRDQFILDRLEGLSSAGLHTLRIDMREHPWMPGIAFYAQGVCEGFKEDIPWPRAVDAPFFAANKSTEQFERLKSARLRGRGVGVCAEVIAAEKDKFVAFEARKRGSLLGSFGLQTSSGKEIFRGGMVFKNSHGKEVSATEPRALLFSQWIPGTQAGMRLVEAAE